MMLYFEGSPDQIGYMQVPAVTFMMPDYLATARSRILDSSIGDSVSETSRASASSSSSLNACNNQQQILKVTGDIQNKQYQ